MMCAGRYYTAVASSSDGTKLVAISLLDPITMSADSGKTWKNTNSSLLKVTWNAAASSSDGTKIVAVGGPYGSVGKPPLHGIRAVRALHILY